MQCSLRRKAPRLDVCQVLPLAALGSLVLLLGWGVEQWRLSDQEVPAQTARLSSYP
jgi:hypothetical protein